MPEPPASPHKVWHSRGYLPHLDQPGAVQFITFRLADAVPAEVMADWKAELNLSGREDADDPRSAELRKRIERYADRGHGACWLRDNRVAEAVQNALLHFDGERYCLLAWVIMPNHVHVLIETLPGFPLSSVVQSWKSFTAKQANRLLKRRGSFWMADYFDRYVRDEAHLSAARSYIEQNPVNAGLVDDAVDWHWCSLGARASRPLDDLGLRPNAGGTPALPGMYPERHSSSRDRRNSPGTTPVGRRRGGIRQAAAARARRSVEAIVQPVSRIPTYALLDPDAEEALHQASMRILEEIGIDFRGDPEALALWRGVGAEVAGERVRIPRELAMAQLALAPDRFTQHARNPARSVEIGGPNLVLAPVYGPPYVRDLDGIRRRGTLEDLENFIKLAHRLPALNHSGGIICEPQDVPVPKRHLEIFRAHVRHSDMPFMGAVNAPERAMDCVEMARIVFGGADAGGTDDGATGTGGANAGERTVLISLVNGNSPLVWDATMLGAMKVYARHRQALLVSPFIMQGANTPVTTAGALAQLNAEAVAGMAFAQLVRPGTPVVYGNTLATVSMQSGAPTYGTAETVILGLAITQLARRYGVPSRTAGMRTGSKTCDADAGAQSMIAMLSALLGRVHFVLHAAGFLESGLSASFAKMVMDADQLSHLLGIARGLRIDDDTLALDAIRDVGPSGHFFGHGHTIEHYDSAFYRPMTAETGTWDQWVEEGRRDVEARAAAVAASLIESFEPPPLDEGIAEGLDEFVARRRRELPDEAF